MPVKMGRGNASHPGIHARLRSCRSSSSSSLESGDRPKLHDFVRLIPSPSPPPAQSLDRVENTPLRARLFFEGKGLPRFRVLYNVNGKGSIKSMQTHLQRNVQETRRVRKTRPTACSRGITAPAAAGAVVAAFLAQPRSARSLPPSNPPLTIIPPAAACAWRMKHIARVRSLARPLYPNSKKNKGHMIRQSGEGTLAGEMHASRTLFRWLMMSIGR